MLISVKQFGGVSPRTPPRFAELLASNYGRDISVQSAFGLLS